MKRFIRIFILSLFIISSNAYAASGSRAFVGADVQFIWYSFYGVPGASVFAGYIWDKLGFEFGYTKPANERYISADGQSSLLYDSNNVYLDGILVLPLVKSFELKGRVGIGYFTTKSKAAGNYGSYYDNWSDHTLGPRAGLGLQYRVSRHLNAGLGYIVQYNQNIILRWLNIVSASLTYDI